MKIALMLSASLLVLFLNENTSGQVFVPDSVRIEKVNKRIGRAVCQCYYWKDKHKVDSVGIEAGINACIPFDVLTRIKIEYYNEYRASPALINFSLIQSSVKIKNNGFEVGLYEFYLGYTSHPTLYKILVFEDKLAVRVKRTQKNVQSYQILLEEFEKRYSKIFTKKEMADIKSVFLEGVIDL